MPGRKANRPLPHGTRYNSRPSNAPGPPTAVRAQERAGRELNARGVGKTTAVRVLSTLLRPDGGWARVAGHDVVAEGAAVRGRIGMAGQYAAVDECLTGRPSVLFLDEPTTGLAPASRLALWGIIGELVGAGTTLLLTTQYLDEADRLADRICVINGGRVTAEGTPAELKARAGASHLRLTVSATASLTRAADEVARYATGPVRRLRGHRSLDVPVVLRSGLVTDIVRALDAAGIDVDDVVVRHPSLDDVFHALTRPAAVEPTA